MNSENQSDFRPTSKKRKATPAAPGERSGWISKNFEPQTLYVSKKRPRYLRFYEDKYFARVAKARKVILESRKRKTQGRLINQVDVNRFPVLKNISLLPTYVSQFAVGKSFELNEAQETSWSFHSSTAQTQVHLSHCALNEIFNRT